jgi:hypothetical protein
MNGNIFNLGELVQDADEGDTDYQVSYLRPNGYGGNETVLINFNICEETISGCENGESTEDDFANLEFSTQHGPIKEKECRHISSAELSEVGVDLIEEDEPEEGLVLTFSGGDSCNATDDYTLQVQLECDYLA